MSYLSNAAKLGQEATFEFLKDIAVSINDDVIRESLNETIRQVEERFK